MATLSTHQLLSHMRGLLQAQNYIHVAATRSVSKNVPQARQFLVEAKKDMNLAKEALDHNTDPASVAVAMLKMFYEQLEYNWNEADNEIKVMERAHKVIAEANVKRN